MDTTLTAETSFLIMNNMHLNMNSTIRQFSMIFTMTRMKNCGKSKTIHIFKLQIRKYQIFKISKCFLRKLFTNNDYI